ncbi:Piwi-domain-containing protein [Pholiota conissans]|uniref:Piwi-domain-containing protein n=1 Tax=Pholiota conissans TaxID=109636 RepID=A0A9P5ZDW0_9AGAR|nr:Piwi-domain-containing protein [Pholiota conissans]
MGTISRPIQLMSNAFSISMPSFNEYFRYDGDFDPELAEHDQAKRRQLFRHLYKTVAPLDFHPRLVYNGDSTFYSPGKVAAEGITFNVNLKQDVQPARGAKGSHQIKINLFSTLPILLSDIDGLIHRGHLSSRAVPAALELSQLIIRQAPHENHPCDGDSYFTAKDKQPVHSSGIELWHGILQSVSAAREQFILTIDSSTAVLHEPGPLIKVAMNFLQTREVRHMRLSEHDPDFKRLEKFLKRLRIKVDDLVNGSTVKTIRGLVPAAGEHFFQEEDGSFTTVKQHFYRAYGITLAYPDIVGVRLKSKHSTHPIIIPAELCSIEEGQLLPREESATFTSDMARFSKMKPMVFLEHILAAAAAYHHSEYIVDSGMTVPPTPLMVEGKILPTPEIEYGRGCTVKVENGAWNIEGRTFYKPEDMCFWAVVNFCPDRINLPQCEAAIQIIMHSCKRLGMHVNPPQGVFHGHRFTVEKDLNNAMEQIARKLGNNPIAIAHTVLVVILPSNDADSAIWTTVKRWGDIKFGIKTQCLREENIVEPKDQIWTNIAMKLNARLGGINSKLTCLVPRLPEFERQPFIIMDIAHRDPSAAKKMPSIASLVYSHDTHATQYAALMAVQSPGMSYIENLRELVEEAVCSWIEKHRTAPRNIVMFRNGVFEGDYEAIEKKETMVVKAAFLKIWERYRRRESLPNITFVVVERRLALLFQAKLHVTLTWIEICSHHVVFFPIPLLEGDKTGNCHPGSVVDTGITHPVYPDFYLQSHAISQDTCRSSHYVVLKDEVFNSTKADTSMIQSLAYSLCYVYAKATRSTSIPVPVYYADIVCSRRDIHISPDAPVSDLSAHDLTAWQKVFQPANKITGLDRSMYFL